MSDMDERDLGAIRLLMQIQGRPTSPAATDEVNQNTTDVRDRGDTGAEDRVDRDDRDQNDDDTGGQENTDAGGENDRDTGDQEDAREDDDEDSGELADQEDTDDSDQDGEAQRGRKRQRSPATWKRNVRKENRARGLEYVSSRGKLVGSKRPLPPCNNCKFKCRENFSDEDRNRVCREYYDLANLQRQRDFLCTQVEEKPKERSRGTGNGNKQKTKSRVYWLINDSKSLRVCQRFFCATLSISEKMVRTALSQKGPDSGKFSGRDDRGKQAPKNKTPPRDREGAFKHIASFPAVESHYCRKDTQRKYLDPMLGSVRFMWKNLYPGWARDNGYNCVSLYVYRDIFNKEFNLGFHTPKKDQCLTCAKFNNLSGDEKETFRPNFNEHIARKTESQNTKAADKERSAADPSFKAVTFDLQAVLYTPLTDVSLLFYKRKLAVYNFTIYEQVSRAGFCYIWPETEGKRGANEIATCLLSYLQGLPENITHVSSFSDTCSGQNRNIFVASAMMYAVRTIDHINTIDLKFMESGHSMMEVDSMHAAIENKKKHQKIYNSHEWAMICTSARSNNPYTVTELHHKDFMDFHKLVEQTVTNRNKAVNGGNVNWMKTKWLRFTKAKPNTIMLSQDLSGEFVEVDVTARRSKRAAARQEVSMDLVPAYSEPLPICAAKKKDLLSLVESGAIPAEYRDYYRGLPCRNHIRDALAEPDAEEEDGTV